MTTLTRGARHIKAAAMRIDQIACNRQPQPHALRKTPGGLTAIEGLEDARLFVTRDAGAGVRHPDAYRFQISRNTD